MPASTHGLSRKVREYKVWTAMKQRCLNPNEKTYPQYGGRGITVYQDWIESFVAWYLYIGQRPSDKHSLERIDNDGNYEPGNIRWATKDIQQHNRRCFGKSGVKGVYLYGNRWTAKIQRHGVTTHLGYFDTKEEASEVYKMAEDKLYG